MQILFKSKKLSLLLTQKLESMTLAEAEKKSGLSATVLSRISNSQQPAKIDVFCRLCSFLNYHPSKFFDVKETL